MRFGHITFQSDHLHHFLRKLARKYPRIVKCKEVAQSYPEERILWSIEKTTICGIPVYRHFILE